MNEINLSNKRLQAAIKRLQLMGIKDQGIVAIGELLSAMLAVGTDKLIETLVQEYPPTLPSKPSQPPSSVSTPISSVSTPISPVSTPAPSTMPATTMPATMLATPPQTVEVTKRQRDFAGVSSIPVLKQKCTQCHQIKDIDKFYIDRKAPTGHKTKCITCVKQIAVTGRMRAKQKAERPSILDILVSKGLPVGEPRHMDKHNAWTIGRISDESGLHASQVRDLMNRLTSDGIADRKFVKSVNNYAYWLKYSPDDYRPPLPRSTEISPLPLPSMPSDNLARQTTNKLLV